jgi:hypothetical protein
MHDSPDEAVPEASAAVFSQADVNASELRARVADAILGPVHFIKAEEGAARWVPPCFERLLRYGAHAALAASVFGFAWLAGLYFFGGQSPFYSMNPRPVRTVVPQESVERAEMLGTVQKMAEEIRAIKGNVEAMRAVLSLSARDATKRESLKKRLDAVQIETGAAIAELAGKVERMERQSTTKLSEVSEQLDRIEYRIAAPRAVTSASGTPPGRKRAQVGRGDAFNPSQNPTAPGVPRPLGSFAPASSGNPTGENAYGQGIN